MTLTRTSLFLVLMAPVFGGCAVDAPADRAGESVESTSSTAERLTLNGFPETLHTEHTTWHMGTPGTPGARKQRMGDPGSGLDFLQFHREFMPRALAWYYAQP